jgi:hypothetical protein
MNTERPDAPLIEDPLARLEKFFIAEYLRSRGYDAAKLHELPDELAKQLMTEASQYASVRLTEVEARAHFVEAIHGVTEHVVE